MIFKVRRGEQWNVQESMMDLTLDISCVYRNQENQQKKDRATLIPASLCKHNGFLSLLECLRTKSHLTTFQQ